MKKSIFAIGLLSLVMILTSFTTTETNKVTVTNNSTLQAVGSSSGQGATVKLDAVGSSSGQGATVKLDAVGSSSGQGATVKLDAVGSSSGQGATVKLD
jgi:ABC-type phosphate transport system substrate-binding protein